MKAVVAHLVILAAIFWGACAVDTVPTKTSGTHSAKSGSDGWRRTANGWEERTHWTVDSGPKPTSTGITLAAVHPLNIATLQALISVAALLLAPTPPPLKACAERSRFTD